MIFKHKPSPFAKDRGRAGALARAFGVSVKTIRDVWIGRTWCRATLDLTPDSQSDDSSRFHKKAGRPLGSKDSKPRVKKMRSDSVQSIVFDALSCSSIDDSSLVECVSNIDDSLLVETLDHESDDLGHNITLLSQSSECVLDHHGGEVDSLPSATDCEADELSNSAVVDYFKLWLELPIPAATEGRASDPFHLDWPFWSGPSPARPSMNSCVDE